MRRIIQPKIPTVIALVSLITAILLGVGIYIYNRQVTERLLAQYAPLNNEIKIINITDSSALVTWQTAKHTSGAALWGLTKEIPTETQDIRDSESTEDHQVHAVYLKNLQPETTYFLKVHSGTFEYPKEPMTFKTGPKLTTDTTASQVTPTTQYKPIIGQILNEQSDPIDEALIYLDIPGAAPLGTVTSKAGNFIIPVALARTESLVSSLGIPENFEATVTVIRGDTQSHVKIKLPPIGYPYPPITLGTDQDLTTFKPEKAQPVYNFDLNTDGQVNSIDVLIVTSNLFKTGPTPADINDDGIVDEKDLDLIKGEAEPTPQESAQPSGTPRPSPR